MSRDINPFGLRMPPELKEKIADQAKESGRSVNAEIVHRLEESLSKPGGDDRIRQLVRAELDAAIKEAIDEKLAE